MKIKLIYEDKKPQITDRMKKYAEWSFQKVDLKDFPTYRQPDGDVVIDYSYLYELIEDEDGIMAVVSGDKLDGVRGTCSTYRGKQIMQVEDYPDKYRDWKKSGLFWKLSYSDSGYPATQYVMEHELGHALCRHYEEHDELHAWIKLKRWEEWWDYKEFMTVELETTAIEWWHEKHGGEIKPKCYILHTDLGTEKGTRNEIINSSRSISYHYYVNKQGEVIEYVLPGFEAWHSGVVHNPTPEAKKFFGNKNPNSMSIGICYEGRGENANAKQKTAIKNIIEEEGVMPIFAHQEITDYKPIAPLYLKRELTFEPKNYPLPVVIKVIQALQKLGIVK